MLKYDLCRKLDTEVILFNKCFDKINGKNLPVKKQKVSIFKNLKNSTDFKRFSCRT